jgi:hypothetical protein
MNNANEAAFPLAAPAGYESVDGGMTKREWLAGMALQGLLASESNGSRYDTDAEVAKAALRATDALLAALAEATP